MNFKDLQYFQKLAQLKSYSETANFFKVSQPTISYAIKRLENQYDVELIRRKSRANSLNLTISGEQFLTHAEKILREDELISKDLKRIKSDKIKMGCPPIITDYLMPIVFEDLKSADILEKLAPVRSGSKELMQELAAGNLDVSLLGTTRLPQSGEFDYQIIKKHDFKVIASAHRNFPKDLKMRDLQHEDFLALDESSVHQQIVNNLVEKYSVFTNVIYQTSDYQLLLNLVKQNKGISLITETALKDVSGIQTLNIVDEVFPPFYLMLVYRSSMRQSQSLKQLIDIFSTI